MKIVNRSSQVIPLLAVDSSGHYSQVNLYPGQSSTDKFLMTSVQRARSLFTGSLEVVEESTEQPQEPEPITEPDEELEETEEDE